MSLMYLKLLYLMHVVKIKFHVDVVSKVSIFCIVFAGTSAIFKVVQQLFRKP